MTTNVGATVLGDYDSPEKRRGARILLGEATVGAVASSIYGNFVGAFAIRIGATTLQMGLLSAATSLLCGISQLSATRVVALFGGRKRMVVSTVLISALPWVFLASVPLVPPSARVWTLIPLTAVAWALFIIADPAWGSWMSDLVPRHRRGAYLGLRGSMVTLVSMTVGMGAAAVLDRLHGAVTWGFVSVFILALLARLTSAALFSRVVDPRPDLLPKVGPPPWRQFAQMGQSALGRYNTFILVFNFAAALMNPLFAVYLLRDLGVSYVLFVGMGVASNIAVVLTMPFWGALADRRGNVFVMVLSAPAVTLWPLLFIVSTAPWYLILAHVVLGATTPGWGIASYNFVLENSDEETRSASVGYYQAMGSFGALWGALVGGAIAVYLPTIMQYQLMTLFVLSAVGRLASAVVLLPKALTTGESGGQKRQAVLRGVAADLLKRARRVWPFNAG